MPVNVRRGRNHHDGRDWRHGDHLGRHTGALRVNDVLLDDGRAGFDHLHARRSLVHRALARVAHKSANAIADGGADDRALRRVVSIVVADGGTGDATEDSACRRLVGGIATGDLTDHETGTGAERSAFERAPALMSDDSTGDCTEQGVAQRFVFKSLEVYRRHQ
jgi:hypothetical protein